MKSLKDIVALEDSTTWYNFEVSGRVVILSDVFMTYEQEMIKVLLADGNEKIAANIRNLGAVKMLDRLRHSVEEGIKMTLSNFKKNGNVIVTSVKTICEVTQEDVPIVECQYSEEDMYSAIMPMRDVPNAGKALFSVQGIVDRVDDNSNERVPRFTLTMKDLHDPTNSIRVTLWRESAKKSTGIRMGAEVTLYDVLLDETGRQYAIGHVAAVKSSFSTTIKVGLWHETDSTGLGDIIAEGTHHAVFRAKVMALGRSFQVYGVPHRKVVVAQGSVMRLLMAARFQYEMGDSVRVTDFQLKDGLIRTLPNTEIELSEGDVNTSISVEEAKKFLHPTMRTLTFCQQMEEGSNVSVQGRVTSASSQGTRIILCVQDQEEKTAKITVWDDVSEVVADIETGGCYAFYGIRLAAEKFKGECDVAFKSTAAMEIQKQKVEGDMKELEANITGTVGKQVVMRIGEKRRLVYCNDAEVLSKILEKSPTKAKVVIAGDDLLSFKDTN